MLKRIPWALLLVLLWAGGRYSGVNLGIDGFAIWVFVILSLITLVFEFYKSGDIMLRSFQADLISAITTTLVLGYGLCLAQQDLQPVDLLVAFVVLTDAIVSPINSFRTALRNMQAAVGPTAVDV